MLDCEARSESTIDKLPTPQHATKALHTFHVSIFIFHQDTFVVSWQSSKETEDSTGLSLPDQPYLSQEIWGHTAPGISWRHSIHTEQLTKESGEACHWNSSVPCHFMYLY